MDVSESIERRALRESVAKLGEKYGASYILEKARAGLPPTELWQEASTLGFLSVNLPAEYGGGGAGISELALVLEELGRAGVGMMMPVVSPAICGTIISRYGTEEQKQRWLPAMADGSVIMSFAITESEAGSNSHRITTTARRDGDDWILKGEKVFISGVDVAEAVLVVARTADAKTGRLKPALFVIPTDTENFTWQKIDMDFVVAENQFTLRLDDVRVPGDALVGSEDAALMQLFAGLNPERIMVAAMAIGFGTYSLNRAVDYAKDRSVWKSPIGAHQGIAHPLAQCKIELELAKLMMEKAGALYDSGDEMGAATAANMAKYAAAEACARTIDQAVHTHGGNGMTTEYGLAALIGFARMARIIPVSREMLLNFVAHETLGLPKSY